MDADARGWSRPIDRQDARSTKGRQGRSENRKTGTTRSVLGDAWRSWRLGGEIPLLLAFICVHLFSSVAIFAADRPNVIVILTDDNGYGDLSITGNPILKTPNTDRLAAEGVWMTRF